MAFCPVFGDGLGWFSYVDGFGWFSTYVRAGWIMLQTLTKTKFPISAMQRACGAGGKRDAHALAHDTGRGARSREQGRKQQEAGRKGRQVASRKEAGGEGETRGR